MISSGGVHTCDLLVELIACLSVSVCGNHDVWLDIADMRADPLHSQACVHNSTKSEQFRHCTDCHVYHDLMRAAHLSMWF